MDEGRRADIGVIGGTGLYHLEGAREVPVGPTPYGAASAEPVVVDHDGCRIAFLPRHGPAHELAPHLVNYRANVWALHQLGVKGVLAPFAAGSLRAGLEPGDLVVCDQLVDRTSGRADTFVEGPPVHHAPFADPYDDDLRHALLAAAREAGATVHDRGTVVVIQGPRFSTRAESQWYRDQGWDVVTMTQYPEAVLARELDLPYAGVALITDRDAGLDGGPPVVEDDVYAVLDRHIGLLRSIAIAAAVAAHAAPAP